MNKMVLCFFVFMGLCVSNNIYSQNINGVTQEMYAKLCGVWDTRKVFDSEMVCSWGNTKIATNGSTIIDIGADHPSLLTGGMGGFNIVKVYKDKDKYLIRIIFRDKKQYDIAITVKPDGRLVFHRMEWYKEVLGNGSFFFEDGEDHPYYRIDGPIIKYYKSKISNLRMRDNPTPTGKIVRKFTQDEKLLIIQKGKEEKDYEVLQC